MVIVFNGLELIGIGIVILLYIVVSIIILVNNVPQVYFSFLTD